MSPRRARPRPDIAYVTKSPESVLWGRTIMHADLKPEIKKEENVTSGLKGQQLAAANAAAADQRAAMAKAKGRYTSLGGQKYMWYLDEIRTQRQIRLFEESQQKAAAKVVMDPDLAAAPGARGVTTQVSLGSLAHPLDTEMPFSLVLGSCSCSLFPHQACARIFPADFPPCLAHKSAISLVFLLKSLLRAWFCSGWA